MNEQQWPNAKEQDSVAASIPERPLGGLAAIRMQAGGWKRFSPLVTRLDSRGFCSNAAARWETGCGKVAGWVPLILDAPPERAEWHKTTPFGDFPPAARTWTLFHQRT
jgi:hypothetical protein